MSAHSKSGISRRRLKRKTKKNKNLALTLKAKKHTKKLKYKIIKAPNVF